MYSDKKNKISRVLIFFLSLFITSLSYSQSLIRNDDSSSLSQLRQEINQLEIQFNNKSLHNREQFIFLQQIKRIQESIDDCSSSSEQKLKKINKLLATLPSTDIRVKGNPYNYLQNEKKHYLMDASYCNFYAYRLQELANEIKSLTPIDQSSYLLQKTDNLLQLLITNFHHPSINKPGFDTTVDLAHLTIVELFSLSVIFVVGFYLKYYLIKNKPKWLKKRPYLNSFSDLPLISALLISSIYFDFSAYSNTLFSVLLNCLSLYLLTVFFIKNVFALSLKTKNWLRLFNSWRAFLFLYSCFHAWLIVVVIRHEKDFILTIVDLLYPLAFVALIELTILFLNYAKNWITLNQAKRLETKTILFISQIFLSYASYVTLASVMSSIPMLELYKSLLIALFNLCLLYLLEFIINKTNFFINNYTKRDKLLFKIGLRSIFLLSLILLWKGYQSISLLIIPNLIVTAIILYLIMDISRFIGTLYALFYCSNNRLIQKCRSILGLKPKEKLIELFILRIVLNIPILIIGFSGLAELWGVTLYQIEDHFNNVHIGYDILGFTLHIPLVIRAINVFCVIALSGKVLASYIERYHLTSEEKHTRYMVASLIRYFMLSFAIVLALYIAQINTNGILVIAGALSVGLGFGLQSFVNNFISGFILMFHKPIRIGDHVIINDTEGYVKKIGSLTTELRTIFQTDIIIPNSSLINESVTNLTWHDKLNRIQVKINVADNINIELAKQLLIDSAKEIAGINQEPINQPFVLYQLNSLTLWCVIDEIKHISTILSELNFEIMKTFNKHEIEITLG